MNEAALAQALGRMQALLDGDRPMDPRSLAEWNCAFAMAQQEGEVEPARPELAAQAHALAEIIQQRLTGLTQERERVRTELKVQVQGDRALKGYGAGLG